MDYKYYRDLKHNYLVFENTSPEDEGNRYQYRMMENGRIKGLLPSSERNINGGRFQYYEVGSMQPLRDRFAVGGMNLEQLRGVLSAAAGVLEELSEYLLGEEGLVFNAKSVFTDLSTGEYKFLYCPFYDEPMAFADFAAELLDLVDLSDEPAAELVYLLCEKSSAPGAFTLEVINSLLGTIGSVSAQNMASPQGGVVVGRAGKPESPKPAADDYLYDMEDFDTDDEFGDDKPSGNRTNGKGSRLKLADRLMGGRLQLLFSLMFAAVVAAMMYIRMNFILTKEENLMSILVMLVSLVTGAVSFVSGISDFRGKKLFGKKQASEEGEELYSTEEYDEFGSYDDFVASENPGSKPLRVTGSLGGRTTGKMSEYNSAPGDGAITLQECGETVVLDKVKESDELTLFSRNLDKTVRIGLESLPITIGKMEGCVDRVLSDMSISRIHCRLTRDGSKVAIEDLGSTNGTYRNGIKLSPREKTYIDEGDEIRIGRICFDCR